MRMRSTYCFGAAVLLMFGLAVGCGEDNGKPPADSAAGGVGGRTLVTPTGAGQAGNAGTAAVTTLNGGAAGDHFVFQSGGSRTYDELCERTGGHREALLCCSEWAPHESTDFPNTCAGECSHCATGTRLLYQCACPAYLCYRPGKGCIPQ